MGKPKVSFRLKFPDLAKVIKKHQQEINLFLASALQFNRGMLFDREGNYNGHEPWAPLKFRNGQILKDTGTLSQSMAPKNNTGTPGPHGIVRIGSGVVTIGTNLHYAWLMNWGTSKMSGGVLKATSAQALKIPLPKGKGATKGAKKASGGRDFMFRKSVKIPARRFDNFTTEDRIELAEAVRSKVVDIIRKGI
jgi:phage gpG-like protein